MVEGQGDEQEIAQAIRSHRCSCKLLLKTADDPILLPIWLRHHLTMFAPEQIIIADNESLDKKVLTIYENLPPGIIVFTYGSDGVGYHNNIHDRSRFKWLYDALRDSCDYTLFLDTDELLYISRDLGHWSTDRESLDEMLKCGNGKAISTTWVHTAHASTNTFFVGDDPKHLAWDLRWGKPFVPSSFDHPGFRIHNVQFPLGLFEPELGANFYLAHLTHYDKEQRIRVNKRKLVARSVIREEASIEEIVSLSSGTHWDPTVRRLISEIRSLSSENWPREPEQLIHDKYARYSSGGKVQYGSVKAETTMSDFRTKFSPLFKKGFET